MSKIILELTEDEAKHLVQCLIRTNARGKDLDVGIIIEDKILELLNKDKYGNKS